MICQRVLILIKLEFSESFMKMFIINHITIVE